ncbi:MAG: outer membrane lipoprotein-sorting protein [Bacillota bacterium]
MKKSLLLALVLILVLSSTTFAITGKEVMDQAEGVLNDGDSMHALMGMDLIEKDGEKEQRTLEVWGITYNQEEDLSKVVMEFQEPASIAETRFLQIENQKRDDDKWIYLPALGRVRRISSEQGDDSFVGSDFTYDDLSTRDVEEDNHKLLKEEKLGEYDCYVVESVPKDKEDAQYAKRINWVTKKHDIPVRVEMYSKKTDQVEKVLTVKHNLKKINGYWTVFNAQMENKETGHATQLYIKRNDNGQPFIEYDKKINSQRFTKRFLKLGR